MCQSIQGPAEQAGVFEYLNSSRTSKEETALTIAQRRGRTEGLIAVLACVEPCQTMQVRGNREMKKLELRSEPAKCEHYDYLDPVYGLRYTRVQTWFPFNACRLSRAPAKSTRRSYSLPHNESKIVAP